MAMVQQINAVQRRDLALLWYASKGSGITPRVVAEQLELLTTRSGILISLSLMFDLIAIVIIYHTVQEHRPPRGFWESLFQDLVWVQEEEDMAMQRHHKCQMLLEKTDQQRRISPFSEGN